MEYIAQFYELFEALTMFVCIFLGLKIFNEVIDLYYHIKFKHYCDGLQDTMKDIMDDILNQQQEGKHSKED